MTRMILSTLNAASGGRPGTTAFAMHCYGVTRTHTGHVTGPGLLALVVTAVVPRDPRENTQRGGRGAISGPQVRIVTD